MKANKIDEILSKCCNLYGDSISVTSRRKIKMFLANPNPQTWDAISGIIIWNAPLINIWTQVCSINPSFDVIGRNYQLNEDEKDVFLQKDWEYIPSPMEVIISIEKLHEEGEDVDLDSLETTTKNFPKKFSRKHTR